MAEAVWHDESGHYRESSQYVDVHIEKERSEEIQEKLGHHNGPFQYTKLLPSDIDTAKYAHSDMMTIMTASPIKLTIFHCLLYSYKLLIDKIII